MSSDRFHRAAKDGLLDVLSKATRNDANSKDDDSMTPVLWAAFEGRLDALRLLCGRGGDPDKCDQFGNTALHLASAKGHLNCVDFLVKFGVNIYALDIDRHSAKDLAAINNRDDILRYLDSATASFETKERKKAKALKELAEKNCEKRMREYMKRQMKLEQEYGENKSGTLVSQSGKSSNVLSTLKQKIWSSQGNLNKPASSSAATAGSASGVPTKYSDLVDSGSSSTTSGSRMGTVQKKTKVPPMRGGSDAAESAFKIGEIEADGRRTVTSLTGLQRDSEILYVGTFSSNEDNGKRGKISDVFEMDETSAVLEKSASQVYSNSTLSRSFSQPGLDFLADDDEQSQQLDEENRLLQRPAGLFDRPMLGSIAFRRSVTAALSQLNPGAYSADLPDMESAAGSTRGGGKNRAAGKTRSFLNLSDTDSDGGDAFSEDDHDVNSGSPIQRFLTVWGLDEYLNVFEKQQIDLDTLMLLTEADLKSLGLPLGPFRKLTFAIQERRNALANPGPMQDSQL